MSIWVWYRKMHTYGKPKEGNYIITQHHFNDCWSIFRIGIVLTIIIQNKMYVGLCMY